MQASLPSFVRMVSVEDIGQGSDQMRILGVRWLPKGAAQHSVGSDGKLGESANGQAKSTSGREDKGEKAHHNQGSDDYDEEHTEGHDQTTAGGMEAEEGDFVNFQIAFAYRPTHSQKKIRERAKHAHLYLAFYLAGNIKIRKSPSLISRTSSVLLVALSATLLTSSQLSGSSFVVSLGLPECACSSVQTRHSSSSQP